MKHRLEARIRELEREVASLSAARAPRPDVAQLEAIIDSAPLAIYLKDAQHAYVLVNREYERLAGRPRSEILGRNDFEIFPEPVARLFRSQDDEVVVCAEAVEFSEVVPLPDGRHSFITSKFPLRSAAGELLGVAGVCTEITALEHAQAQLAQAQSELLSRERLATLGEMSAIIAHEVRNPLGVVFNSLASLQRILPHEPQSQELLRIIREESDRLNRMVSALLEMARPATANLSPTGIEALTSSAIDAALALADSGADVPLDVPQPLPVALVDERLLRQALVNLVSNALQAPARKGLVRVRVDVHAEFLRFAVIDDGAGVPIELAERIFTPFFTTRPSGTGLGLAVVRRAAEAHHGTAAVGPTPGGGATFLLSVPLVVEPVS